MADMRIAYNELMVGANHPTKSDTLNRLAIIAHNSDGKHKGWIDVREYGAAGDGTTDDTAAIQSAINAGSHIFLPEGTYKITSVLATGQDKRIYGGRKAVIKSTAPGAECFNITGNNICLEGFSIEGPSSTAVYVANERAVKLIATASTRKSKLRFKDLYIYNWGMAAFWIEQADDVSVEGCRIDRIGKYGFAGLSVASTRVNFNHITNIAPGASGTAPSLNAYGVMFTRNVTNNNIADANYSYDCEAIGNIIDGVPSWEGLDTHGGQRIVFANNIVRNVAKGVNVTHADSTGTGTDTNSANYISIIGNQLKANTVASGNPVGSGASITPQQNGSRGQGMMVVNNTIEGFGTVDTAVWTHGAVYLANTDGSRVAGNRLVNSNYSAIELEGVQIGAEVLDNYILNVATYGGQNAGVSVDTNTVQAMVDGNSFYRSTGSLDAFSFIPPASGYGVTLGRENQFFGVTNTYASGSQSNIRLGSAAREATISNDAATSFLIPSGASVVTVCADSDANAAGVYKVKANDHITALSAGTSMNTVAGVGTLTGTTGTTGKLNIRIGTGELWVENRLGATNLVKAGYSD